MKKSRGEKQMIAILLISLAAVANLSITVYTPSMPSLVDYFKSSVAVVQFTYTGFLIGFAAGPLIYGPLSDHFGRRPIILTGLLFFLASNIACIYATNIEMLITARVVQAFAISATGVSTAVVRDLFGGRLAARILTYLAAASTLTTAAGPLLGGQLQHYFDWRAVFVFLSLLGALLIFLCWKWLPETNPWRAPRPWNYHDMFEGFGFLLKTPIFLAYSLNGAFILAVIYAYNAATPFIFIDHLGATPETYGLYTIYPTLCYALGSYLGIKLLSRIGLQQSIWAGSLISFVGCLGFAAFLFAGYVRIWSLLVPYCLFIMGAAINLPNTMAGCLNRYPKLAGTSSSFATFLRISIAAFVSVGVGIKSNGGTLTLAWIVPALGLLAVLTNMMLLRLAKQDTLPLTPELKPPSKEV